MIADTVVAFQYPVTVFESPMDVVRGEGSQFIEIFIPQYKAGFSSRGYVFKSEKPRNVENLHGTITHPMKEITILKELAEKIDRIATAQLKIKEDTRLIKGEINTFFQGLAKTESRK